MDTKNNDSEKLYHQVELKLDDIASKILISNNNDDYILNEVQRIVESVFIRAALKISGNNLSKAARMLGINRNTLSRKVSALESAPF